MNKINLILVDDNCEFRDLVKANLSKFDDLNIIAEAGDGVEAIEMVKSYSPDIVLLDLVMPRLDGFGFLSQLKDLDLVKKPKVILISNIFGDAFVAKAMSLGASYYMLKPIEDWNGLYQRIVENNVSENNIYTFKTSISKGDIHGIKNLDEKITNIFITVGIPAHIKGYQFLRDAIKMAVKSPDIINSITRRLYPTIAEHFETSPSKVERAIRHAIEVAWSRGKMENINKIFGVKVYNPNEKPTNGEFIALLADKMLLESIS